MQRLFNFLRHFEQLILIFVLYFLSYFIHLHLDCGTECFLVKTQSNDRKNQVSLQQLGLIGQK